MQLTPDRATPLLARIETNIVGSRGNQITAELAGDADSAATWRAECDRLLDLHRAVTHGYVTISEG